MRTVSRLTLLAALLTGQLALAQHPDKPGSQDHPLLSRFAGSTIDAYQEITFDQYQLPLGPSIDRQTLGDSLTLEGQVTKIFYLFKEEPKPSLLQLHRSYQDVLAAEEVEILFTCFRESCGLGAQDLISTKASTKRLLNGFMAFGEHAYTAGKVSREGQNIYFGVYLKQERANIAYELHFIEVEAMSRDNITMADINEGMAADGKQAFYGLFFDTGKATLKASAEAELELLAQYLTEHPNQQYFIVGHTDNVGRYQSNQALSQARAESVIAALQDRYQIDVSNLQSVGVGPVSPATANSSQAGRALNRRVELVLR